MSAPVDAFRCFAPACLLGAGLGLLYGFLRPLRPRHLADLLFSAGALWAWLYLSFRVCGGDLRLGYTAGLFIGCIGWELTAGKCLRPVFSWVWKLIGEIFRLLCRPFKIIFKKNCYFRKFSLCKCQKMGYNKV